MAGPVHAAGRTRAGRHARMGLRLPVPLRLQPGHGAAGAAGYGMEFIIRPAQGLGQGRERSTTGTHFSYQGGEI